MPPLTRRDLLASSAALAAPLALGCAPAGGSAASSAPTASSAPSAASRAAAAARPPEAAAGPPAPAQSAADRQTATAPAGAMPAVFLPHGGGPWPFMDDGVIGAPGTWDRLATYLRGLRMTPPTPPRAVLVVSAHWEEPQPTLLAAARPPMLYDYYNFPPETYEVQWPAPGAPAVAERIRDLLADAGILSSLDPERGFDHGTFVPLALTYPDADVPTLQLSLVRGLDPRTHLALGRALVPLRNEGVFIVGSGMSYHNMRGLFRGGPDVVDASRRFDEWLAETMAAEPSARETRLVEWERAPHARACHPREEHLLPLMVVAGAAIEDAAALPYRDVLMGVHVSAAHFG